MRPYTLYLIRGPSGSGKSTLARMLKCAIEADGVGVDVHTYAMDDWRMDKDGKYHYNPSQNQDVADKCLATVSKHTIEQDPCVVIVHNTFTQEWEIAPYRKLARECGWKIVEYVCLNMFDNIHETPPDKVLLQRKKMLKTLADLQ